MKSFILAFWGLVFINPVVAQKYSIEKSHVEFFSKATIEDIKAQNTKASGIFNEANGEIVFSIPIQEFQFDKSLMKQHFNEKYMESEKFPKSTFEGKISDYNTNVVGEQKVTGSGKLTIHGVVQEVQIPGTIEKNKAAISMKAKFMVKLVDYKIAIPQLLWKNIAEEVEVTVEFNYKPL